MFLKSHLGPEATWTSFVLSYNNQLPIHRDVHNKKGSRNYMCGFGSYTGGELWLADEGNQEVAQGHKENTHHRIVEFCPDTWHGTCPWEGNRVVLTVYTVRSSDELDETVRKELRALGFPVPRRTPQAYSEEVEATGREEAFVQDRTRKAPDKETQRIQKQLYMLHAATGHGSIRHLIESLKRRGASERVLEVAKQFRCSICEERQRVQPRNLASLEPLPPKWHTVSADVGNWHHPTKGEHVQFLVVIDECTRFRTARILTRGSKQQPSASLCLQYFQEGWVQYFGLPRTLRLDPAGAFRSQAVETYCDKHSIFLDLVPAEAHWQVGTVEQAVQGIKHLMDKLHEEDIDITPEEALSTAVRTFNHREQIRGFSPGQLALGRNGDDSNRIVPSANGLPPDLLVENASGEFERDIQRRASAERAHASWHANQRLIRAKNSKPRRAFNYEPGELVFFWRCQESNKSRRSPGGKHGRFLGPARVLATETRRDEAGNLRPGSVVWCVRGRQLLKCCPEQLRRASEREELVEELSQDKQAPWTFTKVAEEIGGNQYEDISKEAPEDVEWNRAQDPEQEAPPVRHRIVHKRPPPQPQPGDDDEMGEPSSAARPRIQENRQEATFADQGWWSQVPQEAWSAEPVEFWMQADTAVEVEVEVPQTNRGLQQMCHNFEGFFVGALKRKAVEVCERKLSPEDRAKFQEAKAIEVKNFIAAKAFQSLPSHLQPSASQAVGMRWILTWKTREDGSRKAKARAVLLGYQDPAYEHRSTTSPVMTRQTRQMFLQYAAWKRWTMKKGDVSGAFLQGREYPDLLHCIPCPEILAEMGLPPGSVTQLKRACYGLVDAPLEWYRSVDSFLRGLGFVRSWADPCAWLWRINGILRGAISGHVDDFLFMGADEDKEWQGILGKIQEKFRWGDWESGSFVQCGVKVTQTGRGFELSQPDYTRDIKEIPLSASRRKEDSSPISERERTQLRSLLGALSWHAQQVAPHFSAEVSLLLSETSEGTVCTVKKANALLRHAHLRQDHKMLIHGFQPSTSLGIYAWVDAANQNRVRGGSTQGIFIGFAPLALAEGEITEVSPISWHSSHLDRACRSPGAAEGQAAVNGEDSLYFARYQWAEMLHGEVDVRQPNATVARVNGYLITDSRNVYDKLVTEVLVIKGAEKETNIELLSVKEAQQSTGVQVRWVHSEAQLANGLTKSGLSREFELFYQMQGKWRIVEDPSMMSARRRKQMGLQPLEAETKKSISVDFTELCRSEEFGGMQETANSLCS